MTEQKQTLDPYNDFDLVQAKYDDTFDSIFYSLTQQKRKGTLTKESLKILLNDQYLYLDQDWTGRSEVRNAMISGTIAAIEVYLMDWDTI